MKIIQDASELPRRIPLYLFGAGVGGRLLYAAARNLNDVQIKGFIDNNKRVEMLDGVPVLSFSQFIEGREADAMVVIASQYYRDIALQLRSAKFTAIANAYPCIETILRQKRLLKRRLIAAGVAGAFALITIAVLALLL